MRRLLPALALLAAAPASAQETAPAWEGVWEGKVGRFPVRVCLNRWGEDVPGRGSYYYLSRLEPLSLADAGDGMWIESAPNSESEAEWFIEQIAEGTMRGLWRQGERELRFELRPVAWEETEFEEGPCGSHAFIEPLIQGGETHYADAEFEGLRYVRTFYRPPASFADNVTIETFTFDADNPADAAINAELSSRIPSGWDSEWLQCLAGSLSAIGQDGFFEQTVKPTLVTRAFLGVEETSSTYCGGAHPNYYTVSHTFDRRNGTEIDLFDWLGEAPAEGEQSAIPGRLRDLVIARWPAGGDEQCRDLAAESDYWYLGLSRDGIVFTPDMPHAATPCEEPVTVDWRALAPFLDAEGKAGLARLRGG